MSDYYYKTLRPITKITVSFSIHYVTHFGEELCITFDDCTTCKLKWTSGHIWTGAIDLYFPRLLKWSYTVCCNGKILRVESLESLRQYYVDNSHRLYHVFDQWDNPYPSVSPLNYNETVLSKNNTSTKNIKTSMQHHNIFISFVSLNKHKVSAAPEYE
ncbi:hypothetical protein EIN_118580 [Entamoeba invadens IP1]|uniref:Uncharacterized protein n=1 Tax=Entamoeba invadens IP1 TaxID=370355 RepID=L7FNL1_ENTIV|nr:hypothetical protein EIN_118580 [Entamoeba invadens IP1]ELP92264.1 hypothetical protein EIN_118580 [Entamoeba invadens IP1]|eukprot:XP_004259035.1 hypothetical protein EIN_118580 [Entamoeba invadens IP1]